MAEFCRNCAERYDLWYTRASAGELMQELCEGCGWCWVDDEGWCQTHDHMEEFRDAENPLP